MHELVIAAGVTMLVAVLSVSLLVGLAFRRLSRTNRVLPDRRSSAPMSWLWSWAAPARLHRRLRRAARVAAGVVVPLRPQARSRRRAQPPSSPLLDVADALMARAADVDDRLVAASHIAPAWRAPVVAELCREVAELEAAAAHLGRVAATWQNEMAASTRYSALPALDLRSRLDAVEAALFEATQAATATRPERPLSAQAPSLTGGVPGGRV